METTAPELKDDDGIDLILSQVTQEVISDDSTIEKRPINVGSKREKFKTASKILEALNLQNCTNITLNFH